MNGPTGNSEFCFPSILMFPLALPWETWRVSGKQNQLFPWGLVIKCLLFLEHFSETLYFYSRFKFLKLRKACSRRIIIY